MKNNSPPTAMHLMALLLAALTACSVAATPGPLRITGIAFVDASVTSEGSRAKLPAGTKIYPPGSKITGTDGCPTDAYGTTGLIVAVIDYEGRPTAGSLIVTQHRANGGSFERAPYYLDINPGRTLQFLGPTREDGKYDLKLEAGFGRVGAEQMKTSASFTLARDCGSH